ncbi:MAG: YCF48-related protein [Candidatus Kryptoniota bacterium]
MPRHFKRVLSRSSVRISAVAFVCMALLSVRSSAQWITTMQNDSIWFNQIIFLDSLHGYMAGSIGWSPDTSGAIFITTDGGENWVEHKIAIGGLLSVSAVGDSLVWASSNYGEVCRSIDGGKNWQHSTVGYSYSLLTIQFVDSVNGWVIGKTLWGAEEISGIFHSTDGGMTWKQQKGDTCEYYCYQEKGYFADTLHGWVAGAYVISRTNDGGATWQSFNDGANEYMQSVYFLDTLRGWAAGGASISGTVDGGKTWTRLYHVGSGYPNFSSVFFVDILNGWVCDDSGGIMRTTDGGETWHIQRSDTSGYTALNSIFFFNKSDGWAVGNGVILHTTDSGVTIVKTPKDQPTSFYLFQNYPNPFNPSTAIGFQLSVASYVMLKVYDVLGRQVATLVDKKETSGVHAVTWNASKFPSGVYFYRLISTSSQGTLVNTKQMALIK